MTIQQQRDFSEAAARVGLPYLVTEKYPALFSAIEGMDSEAQKEFLQMMHDINFFQARQMMLATAGEATK